MLWSGDAVAAALARPEAYGDQAETVEVRETHISWVFLVGDRAFKLKKPITLPFVDYGTAERRRAMCEEEVRLNLRLAPDVYLGTRSVVAKAGGVVLAPAGHADAIDHVVEMRRFDEARTLAARVSHGGEYYRTLVAVGRRLAEFHADAAAPDAGRATAALHAALAENVDTLLALAPDREFARQVAGLARFTAAFFTARREELELLGSPVAARAVLAGYRDAGGDPGDDALLAFFAAYRALVRANVALVRSAQAADQARLVADARARLALAERFAWRARQPGLVVFAGLSATGKTRLASALARRSGLQHLNSDPVRKRLLGIAPAARAAASAYAESFNRRTYEELGRLARRELDAADGVLVDATFRRVADREVFLAALGGLPARSTVVECLAPVAVRLERARRRVDQPGGVSDADANVVGLQAMQDGLVDEIPAGHPQHLAHGPSAHGGARRPRRIARRPARSSRSVVPPKRPAASCGWPMPRPAVASAYHHERKGRS